MSEDELFCLVVCTATCWFWVRWYRVALCFDDFGRHTAARIWAGIIPLAALAGVLVVLRTVASYDVRDSVKYTLFYLAMGAAWMQLTVAVAGGFGFVMRDDWIERGNPAAAVLGSGLVIGAAAAFAGGNIGDGPGWWVVVFSAGLSTGTMFCGLLLMNLSANVVERITVGRDVGLAVRTGAFLAMAGVIAGRAVAGDWVSGGATVRDFFATAWPLFGIALTLCFFEMVFRRARLSATVSGVIAGLELSYAAYCLMWAGKW
ncbi:MAG: hypothetical protein LBM04_00985 [Opitutaceae bacterium]|jgi:hypothetical protein|nr:hypothetical protein [Opitutaceae bacterium]